MLQPRLENEKFNSLPNLLTSERSHAGFITTDRPDSSQFVDLHVYIIPKKVWKDVQHLAENDAMDDAISAGFVHVSPNMKLCDLRQSIEQSCGTENYFPRDFIFLRSVGRCLTRVKPKQEQELKVKNYRPPQTFAPEIYLLEGRHEDYAHIPSASPAFSSSSYVFGNRVRNRSSYEDDDDVQSPTKFMQNYNRKPMRGGNPYPPALQPTDSLPQFPSSSRQSWAKFTQIGSDPEESSANFSNVTSILSRELSKLKEEQERLRRRQAELERMRRAAEEKKARTAREEEDHRRPQQTLPDREDEERRRRQQQALADREEEERRRRQKQALADQEEEERRRRQQQALADREEEERRRRQQQVLADREEEEERRRRQERAEAERRRLEQERAEAERRRLEQEEAAATKIQASFRGFKDRQAFRERKRRIERERREAESRRRRQLEEEEEQKRKAYELEEQRRAELAKRQREGPEALRARLQELRSRRADLERIREEVIRHLKNIHNRITLRRKDARDMWKKKYFTEKKKTPAFEGRILSLKDELDQIHKKTIHTIDNEFKHTGPIGYPKEAAVGSLMTQVTNTHHQIQDIRHQVEQAKLRLTTDLKLRNQAENECRSLRHELNQAKMNLNHIKTRVGP